MPGSVPSRIIAAFSEWLLCVLHTNCLFDAASSCPAATPLPLTRVTTRVHSISPQAFQMPEIPIPEALTFWAGVLVTRIAISHRIVSAVQLGPSLRISLQLQLLLLSPGWISAPPPDCLTGPTVVGPRTSVMHDPLSAFERSVSNDTYRLPHMCSTNERVLRTQHRRALALFPPPRCFKYFSALVSHALPAQLSRVCASISDHNEVSVTLLCCKRTF